MQGWLRGAVAAWMMLAAAGATAAVPETPRFEAMDVHDGLPSNFITDLAQDHDGYLWIATRDGLAKFDGVAFRIYRFDPDRPGSLPGNPVIALHVDGKGIVWAGIQDKGIVRYDAKADRFELERDNLPSQFGLEVNSIGSGADGSLWLGTWYSGVLHRETNGRWSHYSTDSEGEFRIPSDEVRSVEVDRAGIVWVGSGAGLLKWNGREFERVPVGDLGFPRISALHADRGGLWIGTLNGLRVLTADGLFRVPGWHRQLADQTVNFVFLDSQGTRWLTTPSGLFSIREGIATRVDVRGSGSVLGTSILEDQEGGLWIGRMGGGLLHQLPNWRQFAHFPPGKGPRSISTDFVSGLARAGRNDAWVVGSRGGLDRFVADTGLISRELTAAQLAGCRAFSVYESSDHAVWIGCYDRLLTLDRGSGKRAVWTESDAIDGIPTGPVLLLLEDGRHRLWLKAMRSIQARSIDGHVLKTIETETPGARVASVNAMVTSPAGEIWIAANQGLMRWSDEAGEFKLLPGSPPAQNFCFQGLDRVWIHSTGRLGSYSWDGERLRKLEEVTTSTGLPAVSSAGMVMIGDNQVLLTTARGLIQYDIAQHKLRLLGIADGLPDQEFAPYLPLQTRDGKVLAGTSSGLVIFDPSSLVAPRDAPRAGFESLSVRRNDGSHAFDAGPGTIVLEPGDRDLRVTARVHSLIDPALRHYRFWLHGYDRGWIDDPEGERVFTRLDPGTYTLEMMASTSDGVWSTPKRLGIVVLPPWWQTAWARIGFAGVAALVVFAVVAAFRARVRRIHAAKLLEERRALAEQASAAKSRFLADLGHEIRTPMTGVLGMAELLHADTLEPQQRWRVEAIQAAGQHLLRLLNDALDLARIEAGRLELQDTPFDLRQLLVDVSALLRPQAEGKGLVFELAIGDALPQGVRGDAGRLRQVLLNLGHNAVKFTDAGFVSLRADARDGRVRIEVADTGIGLDAAIRSRLFGRFEQAVGAHSTASHGGSGLGLSICRELIHAMGGTIGVESEEGCGARFTVAIPLPAVELPERRSRSRLQVREANTGVARILLVEDDALVAQVVAEMLARQGHDVEVAVHGLEALARAAGSHFDLVFLDLDLPGLDGFELARMWPQHGLCVPLVALTARADAEAEPLARAAGMVGFVRKPVTGEGLSEMVARHARAREPSAADPAPIAVG